MRLSSRLIHGSGHSSDGGVVPAIQLSSTFLQPTDGSFGEFVYQRGGNPTRNAAEKLLASIEDASHAALTSTGMAATAAVFSRLKPGDKVLLSRSLYGGTYRYVTRYFPQQGISFDFLDNHRPIFSITTEENSLARQAPPGRDVGDHGRDRSGPCR